MYNEQLKRRFINEKIRSESTATNCESLFNATEKFETQWNADVCTRNAAELQPVIDELSGIRDKSKLMRAIILKQYVSWCVDNGIENACIGIFDVNFSNVDRIKSFMVSCPKHLQKSLDEICDPVEENTIDCIYRCYYWLAYGGMDEEDILLVKVSDVDFGNMNVNWKGKEIPIYREAIPAFKNAANLTEFIYHNPNYSKPIIRNRVYGTALIRGIRSMPSLMAMRVELSRRQKKAIDCGKTDMKLSYRRVRLSGMFYTAYENERAGIVPDFIKESKEFAEGKEYKLDSCGNTQGNKIKQISEDYMIDYKRWKKAFSCV